MDFLGQLTKQLSRLSKDLVLRDLKIVATSIFVIIFVNWWLITNWKDKFICGVFINIYAKLLLLLLSHFSRVRLCATPGSPVTGILQARTLEWVAISFSNAWKWKVKVKSLSRAQLLVTRWTEAYQAPLSMDFPGKSTRVGCHCLLRCKAIHQHKSKFPIFLSSTYFHDGENKILEKYENI